MCARQFPVLDENEKNVRLDLTHSMQVEAWGGSMPHYRTTEREEGRGSGWAQGLPFLAAVQRYAHREKVEHSSGKNNYNTTNHWQVRLPRVKIDPKHSVQDRKVVRQPLAILRNKNTKHGWRRWLPISILTSHVPRKEIRSRRSTIWFRMIFREHYSVNAPH